MVNRSFDHCSRAEYFRFETHEDKLCVLYIKFILIINLDSRFLVYCHEKLDRNPESISSPKKTQSIERKNEDTCSKHVF